jgi:hypothetical protein
MTYKDRHSGHIAFLLALLKPLTRVNRDFLVLVEVVQTAYNLVEFFDASLDGVPFGW